MYRVEYIVTGSTRDAHIVRMRPHVDASLNLSNEFNEIFNSLKSQGEFDAEKVEAVNLAADGEEYRSSGSGWVKEE